MPPTLLTPPVSPHSHPSSLHTSEESLQSTVELLDVLIEYYHRKRLWIHHARAALRQTSLRDSICESKDPEDTASIPPQTDLIAASQPNIRTLATPSRCQRHQAVLKVGRRAPRSRAERERIVEQFEELVATRLESCKRLNRLVRNANRARLIDDLQWTR